MKCCFLIPIYNHRETIAATVDKLLPFELPIIIVDDGSNQQTKAALAAIVQAHPNQVILHTRELNGGKGAAVMDGFLVAANQHMTHALQIDADGQHNHHDIPRFLAAAQAVPGALISGLPQYDNSLPRGRKIGRKITHFWVHVETLSLQVKDSMCGFRVYPLAATLATLSTKKMGRRMDFDIEIMVRMYWRNVPVQFIETAVIYPADGRSHFRAFEDNWLISKMHTRLFFGMLLRSPILLARKVGLL